MEFNFVSKLIAFFIQTYGGDFYDERSALTTALENSISRGVRYNGWLYGQHIAGQRALLIWARTDVEPPSVGARLNVVAKAGTVEQHDEYLWITSIATETRTMHDSQGEYAIKAITCELAYPLAYAYAGLEPNRYDPDVVTTAALIYETRYNPDIVALYGIKPLTADAALGDYSVEVDGLTIGSGPTAT